MNIAIFSDFAVILPLVALAATIDISWSRNDHYIYNKYADIGITCAFNQGYNMVYQWFIRVTMDRVNNKIFINEYIKNYQNITTSLIEWIILINMTF